MLTIASFISAALTLVVDLLLVPLSVLGQLGSLAALAVLTGVLMLWVYKRVSNQEAIRRHKKQAMGNLLAVRLFPDDLGVFLKLQGRILGATLRYASHSLKPLAVLFVPVVLLLIQLDGRYGVRPLALGETALLKLEVADAAALASVSLASGDGVDIETSAVRIPSQRQAVWRLRATRAGDHELAVTVGDVTLTKRVVVGEAAVLVPMTRTSDWLDALLHPGEVPVTDAPVTSITVAHPAAEVDVFGWRLHWLIPFCGLAVLTGFALKGVFGVEL